MMDSAAGISRSGFLVAAYLMAACSLDLHSALFLLKVLRTVALLIYRDCFLKTNSRWA
jgi:protein-tyrosine phosphatase